MPISAINVYKRFNPSEAPVLHDINIHVDEGEFIALTGKSGSGKSTLLYILSTLEEASEGRVLIDERDVATLRESEINTLRNEKIGFIFQFNYLLPEVSAIDNVLMPAKAKGRELYTYKKRAQELLELVGLKGKELRRPRQLSGGEQQRVAVARALMMQPKYIFADEPTGSLDSVSSENVIGLLQNINRELQTTVIAVTHDPDFASRASRSIVLVDGRITS